jgi:uncharacterized protein (TIGR00730 family)
LAAEGIELVYGGGAVGLMGIVADAALAAGGHVIGVIPEALMQAEIGHSGLSQLHVVADMHERKALMAELADAFVALPGGLGTFEELFEQLTWAQLGFHTKPAVAVDISGFYGPLFDQMRLAVDEGFMKPVTLQLLSRATGVRQALEMLRADREPFPAKWIQ